MPEPRAGSEVEKDPSELLKEIEINDFELSGDEEEQNEAGKFSWDSIDWAERLERDEIFSKRYTPSRSEAKELEQIAADLSVSSRGSIIGMIQGMGGQMSQGLEFLLHGGHSIIVKRGNFLREDDDCDLVLFTDGFLLLYRNVSALNPLAKRYECRMWKGVRVCYLEGNSVIIDTQDGATVKLSPKPSSEDPVDWIRALERILIEYTIHNPSSEKLTDEVGWQYNLVRKPAFSAAVSGDVSIMGEAQDVNALDEYNSYAPLHYALQHETCNLEIIEKLLNAGADPNLEDNEGRTPMYFAEKNGLDDVKSLLESRGGKTSKLTNIEARGELFGRFEQSQINTARRRENERVAEERKASEAAAKAKSVQDQMSKNMSALVERGEKIEELDSKTKDLEAEAQNFGVMATQLKETMKKKKWYQL
ncbi:unnamed protein product [Cylindrotheca closterium]|uniref:V-SNARE coiled-coil homology domain-containing protein n=1 Tax=Cylindrotheca closterium TaxID=2856 RepID=A0AAD2CV44_9STRA|nr:unnamed protein product [Cylindrotheca closterium]